MKDRFEILPLASSYLLSVRVLVPVGEARRCPAVRLQVVVDRGYRIQVGPCSSPLSCRGVAIQGVVLAVAQPLPLQLCIAEHLLREQTGVVLGLGLRRVQVVVEVLLLIYILKGQSCERARTNAK